MTAQEFSFETKILLLSVSKHRFIAVILQFSLAKCRKKLLFLMCFTIYKPPFTIYKSSSPFMESLIMSALSSINGNGEIFHKTYTCVVFPLLSFISLHTLRPSVWNPSPFCPKPFTLLSGTLHPSARNPLPFCPKPFTLLPGTLYPSSRPACPPYPRRGRGASFSKEGMVAG